MPLSADESKMTEKRKIRKKGFIWGDHKTFASMIDWNKIRLFICHSQIELRLKFHWNLHTSYQWSNLYFYLKLALHGASINWYVDGVSVCWSFSLLISSSSLQSYLNRYPLVLMWHFLILRMSHVLSKISIDAWYAD